MILGGRGEVMSNREIPTHQEVADLLFNHHDPSGDVYNNTSLVREIGEWWDHTYETSSWTSQTEGVSTRKGTVWRRLAEEGQADIMKLCDSVDIIYNEMERTINREYEENHNLRLKIEEMRQKIRDLERDLIHQDHEASQLEIDRDLARRERDEARRERDETMVELEENEECLQQMIDEYLPQANLS